jgi:hypothetical protein
MNSIFQIIKNIPPLFDKICNVDQSVFDQKHILFYLKNIFVSLKEKMLPFNEDLEKIVEFFGTYLHTNIESIQQSSEEFFFFILEEIDKYLKFYKESINDYLSLQIKTTTICPNNHKSVDCVNERIYPIPTKNENNSFLELLDNIFQEDKTTRFKYDCCNRNSPKEIINQKLKLTTITDFKEYLIFSLKIFDNNLEKKNHNISFPTSIEISKYFDEDLINKISSPVCYELISVNYHNGKALNSGHYFTIILNKDGKHVKFDDKSVDIVDGFQNEKNSTVYIMVFKKKGKLFSP